MEPVSADAHDVNGPQGPVWIVDGEPKVMDPRSMRELRLVAPAAGRRYTRRAIEGPRQKVECKCGAYVGHLVGAHSGAFREGTGRGISRVPDPSKKPHTGTAVDDVIEVATWSNSRWKLSCRRCRVEVVRSGVELDRIFRGAVRAGRESLVLGDDL